MAIEAIELGYEARTIPGSGERRPTSNVCNTTFPIKDCCACHSSSDSVVC